MKKLLLWFPVSMLFATCVAFGDIPDVVDYHLKWSGDPGAGVFEIIKNDYGYDDPIWRADHKKLFVDNYPVSTNTKHIWVEVEWISQMNLPANPPDILIDTMPPTLPENKTTFAPVPTASGMGWTWYWTVFPQPEGETIQFPDEGYWHLGQVTEPGQPYFMGVDTVEVGTWCIPEPTTLLLLTLGCMGLVLKRRRGV